MNQDSPYLHWQAKGNNPSAIVLMGMSGIGKSYWSDKYGQKSSAEEIRDMPSETREILSKGGLLLYISADNEIASLISHELCESGVDESQEPVEMLAEFIGKFGSEQDGGFAYDKFMERQEKYREAELASLHSLPGLFRSAYEEQPPLPDPIIYDTTGSFCEVVKSGDAVYRQLAKHAIIAYLACSAAEEEILLRRQREHPKPMLYDKIFFDECLRKYKLTFGQSDEEIISDDFLRYIFAATIVHRRGLYEKLAQVTITTEELEKIYDEYSSDGFAGAFIERVCGKYTSKFKVKATSK